MEWGASPLKGHEWNPYISEERRSREGELDKTPAERTLIVDPLNLIRVIPAEGTEIGESSYRHNFSFRLPDRASSLKEESPIPSDRDASRATVTKKIALTAVLIALTVVLSPFYIPLGTTKCFPAQHLMNAVAGVLLGPWYAALMALATGTIRNILGMGTIYAFPGGIPGALVVAPWKGHPLTLYFFWVAFAASSVPGSALGFVVLKALRRMGIDKYFI